jgi:sodium-dependent phosphate cotransporter
VAESPASKTAVVRNALLALFFLYTFLVGIQCLSGGIKGLGSGIMDQYLGQSMNPILGLLVGVLATTLVQSSSVTTSLIVAVVASGQVPVSSAVPMIMGANIGTTVTNTIASLAHAAHGAEFRRAFKAATVHDFFNFLSVIVLLPMELITRWMFETGLIERLAYFVSELTTGATGAKYHSPLKAGFKWGASLVKDGLKLITDEKRTVMILLIVAGVLIIYISLTLIVKTMRSLVLSRLEQYVNRFLGSGGLVAIGLGVLLTVSVQSSSITTSVLVPLAGAGLLTTRQVFPITVGANIGTTITALLASMVVSGDTALAARQIAFVHLIFNLLGTLVWFVPARTREFPLRAAEWLSGVAAEKRRWAVVYVALVFYGLPLAIFGIGRLFE